MKSLLILLALCVAYSYGQQPKIVSCYYSSWAFYRPGDGQFDVDHIDPFLCTHGFYGFAGMDNQTYEVYAMDPWFDLGNGDSLCPGPGECNYDGMRRFVGLKEQNPDFVPMISVGGWNAGSQRFSEMVADPGHRATFIASVIEFCEHFGFEGVDFDWEYPGSREGSDPANDKANFVTFSQELSLELHARGLLLSAAMGMGYDKIELGYDMAALSPHYDFFNLMGYDFQGAWNNFTGHNAPLFHRPEEQVQGHPGYRYNVWDSLELYISLGTPRDKIVLGMPSYGRGWQIVDNDNAGLFCPADNGFPMGPITRQRGIRGYNEILSLQAGVSDPYLPELEAGGWNIVRDDCYMAPFMHNGPYWISYDDPESIGYKVRYANLRGLRGVMVWSLETDDFRGLHSAETYPILRRMNAELQGGQTYNPEKTCGTLVPACDGPFPSPAPVLE